MKIVNAMFGAKLGGLEQVFVDYGEALRGRGHEVMNIVTPGAEVIAALDALALPHWAVANFNQYDVIAMARIRARLAREKPDAVIAQGNRAIRLLRGASRAVAPFIAVNHSVNIRRTIGADFVIAINDDMRARLIAAGQPESRVFKLFNMVRRPDPLPAGGRCARRRSFPRWEDLSRRRVSTFSSTRSRGCATMASPSVRYSPALANLTPR